MALSAVALVIVAAALHATWHLLVKRTEQRQLFTGWVLAVAALLYSPILLFFAPIAKAVWPYAVVSAIVQGTYFVLLVRAYERADFSLAYPIARGSAPALLALWGVVFLGEHLNFIGILGLAGLLSGLLIVGLGFPSRRSERFMTNGRAIFIALGVALCISIYSAIDGKVVRDTPVLPYLAFVTVLTGVFVTPFIFAHYGMNQTIACWRAQKLRIIVVGILPSIPYFLVLRVYAISGVSYAGALREVSIVFAALAGRFLLGEPFGALRVAGSLLIFAGIVVIAVAA
jgi:drug/metabolite transporter (DMT)-like permease